MKLGKNYFPKLFRGIGPKTMEKFAAKVVPFIGPAIDIAMGIFDYYQAKSAEEKKVEEQRLYLQRLSEQSAQLVEEVENALLESYTDIIRQIFTPLMNQIQDELDTLSGSQANNERIAARLRNINDSLA